jgi:nicotinamide riboside kinase/ribosomal protein S18 acetylase RimI-like enzyme
MNTRALRVVLIGAESTGKTTLCEQLAAYYETEWVGEYGREHWERKIAAMNAPGEIPAWTDDEFIHIAEVQQARENEAAARANRVLICDTNAFATATWFERYANTRHPGVDAIGARDLVDLYLVPAPDIPFVQDGVRDGEKIRDWMHARFVELIKANGTPYVLITGPYEARLPKAIAAIDTLLALKRPPVAAPRVRVRRAVADDAERLAHIGTATFVETYSEIIDGANMAAHCTAQHSKAVYEAYLAHPGCAVWLAEYEETGAPVGYAVNCPPDLPIALQPGDVELKRIYALSRFHGSGAGRLLMDAAIEHARACGAPRLLLGTYEDNRRAIAFYRKHGFEMAGTRQFRVGERLYDDVVLAKPL